MTEIMHFSIYFHLFNTSPISLFFHVVWLMQKQQFASQEEQLLTDGKKEHTEAKVDFYYLNNFIVKFE